MTSIPSMLKIHGDKIREVCFSTHVAGTTFVKNSDSFLRFLKDKVPVSLIELYLEREPTNKADPNAVKVMISMKGSNKHRKIGYVPADRAELLSYVLDHKQEYRVFIYDISLHGGEKDKPNIGIFFSYTIDKI